MGDVHELPILGREFFIDDDGTVLRATWHLDRGLVNFSVWRDALCTETFPLAVSDAARLIGYLADGLSTAATSSATAVTEPHPVSRLTAKVRQFVARTVAR